MQAGMISALRGRDCVGAIALHQTTRDKEISPKEIQSFD
jgi:hypothetical protein